MRGHEENHADPRLLRAWDTIKRLNRRCQVAESGLAEFHKIMARKPEKAGIRFCRGSLGRALLAAGYDLYRRRLEKARRIIVRMQKRQQTKADEVAHRYYMHHSQREAEEQEMSEIWLQGAKEHGRIITGDSATPEAPNPSNQGGCEAPPIG